MKFYADYSFSIGNLHSSEGKPCQDYAIADVYSNKAVAVVSDGCSSGRHTDIGSRLISLNVLSAVKDQSDDLVEIPSKINLQQENLLANTSDFFNLKTEDLLATSLFAFFSSKGGLIYVQGDGVVAIKYRDGKILLYRFDWLNNMPFYPIYKTGDLLNQFIAAHGGDLNKECLQEEIVILESNGEINSLSFKQHSLSCGITGITINIPVDEIDQIEFVALFSDGVTQIDGLDWKKAVFSLMNFKNPFGVFVKRRMIRFLKDIQKEGKKPLDDISISVIHIVHQEEIS